MNRGARFVLASLLLWGAARADDAPAPRCKYVQVAKLPVRYLGPGLVPAVDGSINGTPATMLVDTGAGFSSLTMTAATRRNLTLYPTGTRVNGVGGIARIYTTRVREMAVGATAGVKGLDMSVIADTAFTPAYDAILGASFLMQADMELDLSDKRLRFFRPVDCDHARFNIWKNDNTISVPFIDSHYDRSDNPHFSVLVNGIELDALIDTGAGFSFLAPSAAKRLGIAVDAPGVTQLPASGGIGSERVASWSAPVQTVQIGDEIIQKPRLGIVAIRGRAIADLYLGQDFLRAHRVLFAMGQKKLYLSYRGDGEVFARGAGIEPWIRAEAEGGNPDAEYLLAVSYEQGRGVQRDPVQARAWLEKAAAAGEPHANMELGRQQLQEGQAGAAIPRLRGALDQLPSDAYLPLWLYLARLRNGEADLARRELAASHMAGKEDQWPEPIARFYLGKLDAAGLLARAGAGDKLIAFMQGCTARNFMGQWYAAQGDSARAEPLQALVRSECGADAIIQHIKASIDQKP